MRTSKRCACNCPTKDVNEADKKPGRRVRQRRESRQNRRSNSWLGGADLYVERFGHPRLRARHLPYPIGVSVRDQWLSCMGLAMAEISEAGGFTADMQERLMISFANAADHMRYRAG